MLWVEPLYVRVYCGLAGMLAGCCEQAQWLMLTRMGTKRGTTVCLARGCGFQVGDAAHGARCNGGGAAAADCAGATAPCTRGGGLDSCRLPSTLAGGKGAS
jgi:hypothetical protein